MASGSTSRSDGSECELHLSFRASWRHVESVVRAASLCVESTGGDRHHGEVVAKISMELLQNAIQHGTRAPGATIGYRLNCEKTDLIIEVSNQVGDGGEERIRRLQQIVEWIKEVDDPRRAYAERIQSLSRDASASMSHVGVGLVRIAYEGHCRLGCELIPPDGVVVRARYPLGSWKPPQEDLDEDRLVGRGTGELDLDEMERASVLVVDDMNTMRVLIAAHLSPHYTVHLAADGVEGLERARDILPDLIISDVVMPRMNGVDLCRAVKEDPGPLGRTPFILLTGEGKLGQKLQGLEAGSDDYLTKPFNRAELLARAKNLITLRRQEQQLVRTLQALEEKERLLQEDLSQARSFQHSLLPELPEPSMLRFGSIYRPTEVLGGDLYDIFDFSQGRFRVLVADVTGHGVQAALRTMVIKSEYERLKLWVGGPGELLTRLNRQIVSTFGGMGLCFTACCIDLEARPQGGARVCYANAGHPALLHLSASGPREVYQPGPFLGVVEQISVSDQQFMLDPGDRLFAMTDGLLEEQNERGEEFGLERVKQALGSGEKELQVALQQAVSRLDIFLGDRTISDDVTLVGIECSG